MEVSSRIDFIKKIQGIANGKIPVAEDSPTFQFFLYRKEVCLRLIKGKEENRNDLEAMLEHCENSIKKYFYL